MKRLPLTTTLNGTSTHTTPSPVFRGGILYVEGAAALLNTTQKAIRTKVARHVLPYHKLEGRVIFFRDELEHFLSKLPGVTVQQALDNIVEQANLDEVRR